MTAVRWLVCVAVLAGCGKTEPSGAASSGSASAESAGSAGSATPASSARDAVIAAWKAGGLTPSAFTVATTPVGPDCATGTVNSVDVMICVFGGSADAKAAEDKGLTWVGGTTGAAQARGNLLIGIADRHKADPSGRTINQLMKLAPP